jgi:uncharacterized glyoxalase superfamily protein PhnB
MLDVRDVDASVKFYADKLGFQHQFSMAGPEGETIFAMVGLGPAIVIGFGRNTATEQRGQGVMFMLYVPDDVDLDRHYESVKDKGVAIVEEIGDRYWGDRTYSIKDPDGYLLSFARTVKQMTPEEIQAMQGAQGA